MTLIVFCIFVYTYIHTLIYKLEWRIAATPSILTVSNYMAEFNSTRGNWVGFTNFSIALATFWNNDPTDAAARALERKLLCAATLDIIPVLGKRFVS
uniref:Uncharacterized protein n=1 Tax=Amphilophus citrinellus TaxID=61819 RepID=A0A3Q0RGH1_AMPCI